MPSWSNWSGKLQAQPDRLHFLRSEPDAQAVAREAANKSERIRVAGATHSHSPLVAHDGIIIDTSGLSGVIEVDREAMTAWVWAGTRIYALGRPLHETGLGLYNQGDIDQQAIAGATATGTHGTGIGLKNLSSAVVGACIAAPSGELIKCSAQQNPELWQACRLHLGALGIVTRLQLQLRPAYCLAESAWTGKLDDVLSEMETQAYQHRHHEFFWYPQTDQAQGKSIDETTQPPVYPLGTEGERSAWSYEVLPNHRPHKHTEMEYSVPLHRGPDCMAAIRNLLTNQFTDVRWPVEYRTLAADDVWLSTAYERDTVTISVHQDVNEDDEPYFRACEEIFLAHDGLPHWGKVNYLSGEQLSAGHARWSDWWRVRDEIDPNGTFLNDYLMNIRPA
jgi:FAD/FMN-containing dehydrogenase